MATCCSMGLYPTLSFAEDWSKWGLYSPAMGIRTICIDWEIPEDVFTSHWNAPWNKDYSHGIPF
jgi:hypothetical protein